VTFEKSVGNHRALGALYVDARRINIERNITTWGDQTYIVNIFNLGRHAFLSSGNTITIAPQNISRNITVGGTNPGNSLYLSVNTLSHLSANTMVIGNMNDTGSLVVVVALSNAILIDPLFNINNIALTVSSSGHITLNNSITTSGDQTFTGAVTLGSDTSLTGANITFNSTIDSPSAAHALTISDSISATFGGAVGGSANLSSLSVTGLGSIAVNGGSIATTGTQTYSNLSLGADTTLIGTSISVLGPITGNANSLTITGNAVLGNTAVDSLNNLVNLSVFWCDVN